MKHLFSFFLFILLIILFYQSPAQVKLEIETTTGNDDYRESFVQYPATIKIYWGANVGYDKRYIEEGLLYSPSNGIRVSTRVLPNYITLDSLKNQAFEIYRAEKKVKIKLDAIKGNLNADNWDIKKIVITATLKENGQTKKYLLFSKEGNPLTRIIYNEQNHVGDTYIERLKEQPELISGGITTTSQSNRVSKFLIELGTGGDDLRGDGDNATIVIKLKTYSNTLRIINLVNVNRNRKLNNFQGFTSERPLFPEELDIDINQIFAVGIKHDGGGGMGADNWDLDRVKISIIHRGQQKILIDKADTPLFRFTGDNRYKEFEVE